MTYSSPGACSDNVPSPLKGGFLSNHWPLLARNLVEWEHSPLVERCKTKYKSLNFRHKPLLTYK